jgi:hypothetical protein
MPSMTTAGADIYIQQIYIYIHTLGPHAPVYPSGASGSTTRAVRCLRMTLGGSAREPKRSALAPVPVAGCGLFAFATRRCFGPQTLVAFLPFLLQRVAWPARVRRGDAA